MTSKSKTGGLVMHGHKSLIYILVALALLYLPFVDKAFTVDDTLFLRAAEHILVTPFDFYGGEINWFGSSDVHFNVNKNPPFVSYLIASIASVFGFNEVMLHVLFFLVPAATAIGIYRLGMQFKADPFLTALLAVFTPVFLVHSTNLMSDAALLMFWVWGVVFWMTGIGSGTSKWFYLAGLSIALGVLTKYTCVFILPLIMFSGVWQYRKAGQWMVAVFIPVMTLAGFEYYTRQLYGKGLFLEAFVYANEWSSRGAVDYLDNTLIGLSFLGGCFPAALLLAPITGKRFLRLAILIFAAGLLVFAFSRPNIGEHTLLDADGLNVSLILQFCVFSLGGVCLVLASLKEIGRGLDHDTFFLLLWFIGVFVFVCYLNWAINARSFILLVPVAGILLARRIEEWVIENRVMRRTLLFTTIGIAGLLALATMHGDYTWANTARFAAGELNSRYGSIGKIWFQGHWGFQYYMEALGARPVDYKKNDIKPGEFVVIPINNTNLEEPNHLFDLVEVLDYSSKSWAATMNLRSGAGFYASVWGPIPYSFGESSKEVYLVYRRNNRG